MDEKIIELRNLVDKYGSLINSITGNSKESLARTYLENLGHKFKNIKLNSHPYNIVIKEMTENEVIISSPLGDIPVREDNAIGYLNLLVTFKNDLTL